MRKSEVVLAVARRVPALSKLALWAWVRLTLTRARYFSGEDHWFMQHMAVMLAYRVPIWTRLPNGLKIRVAGNDMIGRRIYEHGYYEPEMVQLIEQLLEDGMVFFDVGAHVGQYTLVASQCTGARGEVHSFEPDPHIFAWLAASVRTNRLRNVTLNQCAVAADQEPKRLYFAKTDDIGSNSLAEQKPLHHTGRSALINCTTLDAYVSAKCLAQVDLIKADVEGAELLLLHGAKGLLTGAKPPMLLLEFEEERQRAFGSSCVQLAEELQQYGYQLWRVSQSLEPYIPRPADLPSFNIFAVHTSQQAVIERVQGVRRVHAMDSRA